MKRESYIVFGSGGHAKEVISYIEDDGHTIACVVSTSNFNHESYNHKYKVLQSLEAGMFPEAKFVLAVGDVNTKKIIVEKNESRWTNFIHSSCSVSKYATLGVGNTLSPYSCVNGDSVIGNFVTLNVHTTVSHDSIVNNFVTFSPYSGVMGNCRVGDECFFGTASYCIPNVTLGNKIKVSAGSVVRHSFLEDCVLRGNPAKPK